MIIFFIVGSLFLSFSLLYLFSYHYFLKNGRTLIGKVVAIERYPLYFPLPSPVDIIIGKPYEIPELSAEAHDDEIDFHIDEIKKIIHKLTEDGLKKRRPFFANKADLG